MLNVKKTLTKILDALKVDFIVEEGTNNSWTYRKWNSGVYEAWRAYTGSQNLTTASAGTYYSATPISVSAPSFTTGISNSQATPKSSLSSGVFIYKFEPASSTSLLLDFRSHTSASGASVSAYLYIRGTWGGGTS